MSLSIICKSCGNLVAGYTPKKASPTLVVAYAHLAQDRITPRKPNEPIPTKICEGSKQLGDKYLGN